jgi:glycosyltransferase involved in cell wall biosynthesis
VRVQLIDPSAFTPPYDRALARALAAAGAEVELITSRFLYGPVPEPDGYRVSESFYRRTARRGLEARGRRAYKLAEHLPDMLRLRRQLTGDLTHYQWLTVPGLDHRLIPHRRPRVLTAHYIASPEPSARELRRARRVFGGMDAVIAHSETGAARLRDEIGLPGERVRVIPHGAFDYLTELKHEDPLPPELEGADGPVILFFGLLRPYKGIDLLIEAFSRLDPADRAELWIVGNPRMDISGLREAAAKANGKVRWLPRFIPDAEIPAIMRRADLLVLPYRDGEQSGVLYTGLAFGKAMVISDVGGFGEVARTGDAARLVPAGDAGALAGALAELTSDSTARERLAERAAAAGSGDYGWQSIAEKTLDLYRELLG